MVDVSEDAIERRVRKALGSLSVYSPNHVVTVDTVMDGCTVINYRSGDLSEPGHSFEIDLDGICYVNGIHGSQYEELYGCIEKIAKHAKVHKIRFNIDMPTGAEMHNFFLTKGFKVQIQKRDRVYEKILVQPKPAPTLYRGGVPQDLSTEQPGEQ